MIFSVIISGSCIFFFFIPLSLVFIISSVSIIHRGLSFYFRQRIFFNFRSMKWSFRRKAFSIWMFEIFHRARRVSSIWSRVQSLLRFLSLYIIWSISRDLLNVAALKHSFKLFDLQDDHSILIFFLFLSQLKLFYLMRESDYSLIVNSFFIFDLSFLFNIVLFKTLNFFICSINVFFCKLFRSIWIFLFLLSN